MTKLNLQTMQGRKWKEFNEEEKYEILENMDYRVHEINIDQYNDGIIEKDGKRVKEVILDFKNGLSVGAYKLVDTDEEEYEINNDNEFYNSIGGQVMNVKNTDTLWFRDEEITYQDFINLVESQENWNDIEADEWEDVLESVGLEYRNYDDPDFMWDDFLERVER